MIELLLTFLVLVIVIGLAIGLWILTMRLLWPLIQRVEDRAPSQAVSSADQGSAAKKTQGQVSSAGIGLALVGASLMLIGVFLPWAESSMFTKIEENTLIQSGDGFGWVLWAVFVVIAAYDAHRQNRRGWSILILGVIGVAFAVYSGTGDRLALNSVGSAVGTQEIQGNPGLGIYVTGVGSVLTSVGGWLIAGFGDQDDSVDHPAVKKTCPECQFDVPASANICGHCRHSFV